MSSPVVSGVMASYPGINSKTPTSPAVSQPVPEDGLPMWAIILIIIAILVLGGGVTAFMLRGRS